MSPRDPAYPPASRSSDFSAPPPSSGSDHGTQNEIGWLKSELLTKTADVERLNSKVQQLEADLDSVRGDYSAQTSDEKLEIRTLQSLLEKAQGEIDQLHAQLARQKKSNKSLKSQNLRLQYHLNVWGIPVAAGAEESVPEGDAEHAFFPKLNALLDGLDPIPSVLRGDIYTFDVPNLLHFLANSQLTGVLTMVASGIVAKLYLEDGILRLAGWNRRENDLRLAAVLENKVESSVLRRVAYDDQYDLELAETLLKEEVPAATIQEALREHAKAILMFIFQVDQGSFFFQPGKLRRQRSLQFNLPILDLLLEAAREVDHRERDRTE